MLAFIVQHLWQSTLVLIAAWFLTLICRRNAAEVRYWIWFAASAKFLVPFALPQWLGDHVGQSLSEPLPVDPALIEISSAIFLPAIPDLIAIPGGALPQIGLVVAAIWALGAAITFVRWFLQWRAVRSTLAAASEISMDLPVPVRVTSDNLAPGVFGVFRPVVLMPRVVMRELSREHMQAVLAHELWHVRRQDNLTAAIHKCVEAIFWFHPLVWWLGANLLREREAACDEAVLEEGHEQAVYAESILQVCRLGVTAKFSGMAGSTGGVLTQRISSIMREERAPPIDRGRFALLFVTALVACYGPIAAGVVGGAVREAADAGPITFKAVTLDPAEPRRWRNNQFDPDARRLALKNVSLRDLISLAYPGSWVNADAEVIDRAHYDIEAHWYDEGRASERNVYRQLLGNILRTNSNLQLYVTN